MRSASKNPMKNGILSRGEIGAVPHRAEPGRARPATGEMTYSAAGRLGQRLLLLSIESESHVGNSRFL